MITEYYILGTVGKSYNPLTFQLGIKELDLFHHLQQRIKGIILSSFGYCFLVLSLTNLSPKDAESLFMLFLRGHPLGLLLGLLLLQPSELHLDFLNLDGSLQLRILGI